MPRILYISTALTNKESKFGIESSLNKKISNYIDKQLHIAEKYSTYIELYLRCLE